VVRHQEQMALEEEVTGLQDRLETRRLVDRAKGILMDRYGMREADAFRFLQKAAMDGRLRMQEVARRVLEGIWRPDPGGGPARLESPSGMW
jgi:two-component system, response regulator PdtaR